MRWGSNESILKYGLRNILQDKKARMHYVILMMLRGCLYRVSPRQPSLAFMSIMKYGFKDTVLGYGKRTI